MNIYYAKKDQMKFYIIPFNRGYVKNREIASRFLSNRNIGSAALPISAESLWSMTAMVKEGFSVIDLSEYDEAYVSILIKSNIIELPEPAYCGFMEYQSENMLKIHAVDMDEELYAEKYCEYITTYQLYKYHKIVDKFRQSEKIDTPERVLKELDNAMYSIEGFRKLENYRVDTIITKLLNIDIAEHPVVYLSENDRVETFLKRIKATGFTVSNLIF